MSLPRRHAPPSLSVNPAKNLWQCFGCQIGEDTIRFVELFGKVSFPEALEKLDSCTSSAPPAAVKQQVPGLSVKEQKLLVRVVSCYQHTFAEDKRGMNYLKIERGISDNRSLQDCGAGFVNGSLPEILPQDEAITEDLKKIDLLNKKGRETFYNYVVFPR